MIFFCEKVQNHVVDPPIRLYLSSFTSSLNLHIQNPTKHLTTLLLLANSKSKQVHKQTKECKNTLFTCSHHMFCVNVALFLKIFWGMVSGVWKSCRGAYNVGKRAVSRLAPDNWYECQGTGTILACRKDCSSRLCYARDPRHGLQVSPRSSVVISLVEDGSGKYWHEWSLIDIFCSRV